MLNAGPTNLPALKPPIANPLTPAPATSQQQADDSVAEELAALREEFPQFRIWREDACDRVRFVARSLRMGLNPHTVVTDDLDELRTALEASRDIPPAVRVGRRWGGTP